MRRDRDRHLEHEMLEALKKEREKLGYVKDLRLLVSNFLFDVMMSNCPREEWDFNQDYYIWRHTPIIPDRRLQHCQGPDNWEFVVRYKAPMRSGQTLKEALAKGKADTGSGPKRRPEIKD